MSSNIWVDGCSGTNIHLRAANIQLLKFVFFQGLNRLNFKKLDIRNLPVVLLNQKLQNAKQPVGAWSLIMIMTISRYRRNIKFPAKPWIFQNMYNYQNVDIWFFDRELSLRTVKTVPAASLSTSKLHKSWHFWYWNIDICIIVLILKNSRFDCTMHIPSTFGDCHNHY